MHYFFLSRRFTEVKKKKHVIHEIHTSGKWLSLYSELQKYVSFLDLAGCDSLTIVSVKSSNGSFYCFLFLNRKNLASPLTLHCCPNGKCATRDWFEKTEPPSCPGSLQLRCFFFFARQRPDCQLPEDFAEKLCSSITG